MGFLGLAEGDFSRAGGWAPGGAAMRFEMAVSKLVFSFAKQAIYVETQNAATR